jgi:hypothetical protein
MPRRTVSITDEVYAYIAERGRFGESTDDVLRRLFSINNEATPTEAPSGARVHQSSPRARQRLADRRLSATVSDGFLRLAFAGGPEDKWQLPASDAHDAIAELSIKAQAWAESHGATYGQQKAVHKALTESGYYNTGPRR